MKKIIIDKKDSVSIKVSDGTCDWCGEHSEECYVQNEEYLQEFEEIDHPSLGKFYGYYGVNPRDVGIFSERYKTDNKRFGIFIDSSGGIPTKKVKPLPACICKNCAKQIGDL